jgi:hypothetical protein
MLRQRFYSDDALWISVVSVSSNFVCFGLDGLKCVDIDEARRALTCSSKVRVNVDMLHFGHDTLLFSTPWLPPFVQAIL